MIRSMTGFGDASEHVGGVSYSLEVRSLNNRYFKASIRLPEEIAGLEAEIESRLRKRISRGSITLTAKLRADDDLAAHKINDAALLRYLDHLETIHTRVAGGEHAVNIDLTALLALPGVLQPAEEEHALLERSRPVLLRLVDLACQKLAVMRQAEGQAIAEDLLAHRGMILTRLGAISARAPGVVDEYHQRLRARMEEMLAKANLKVDERDLIREVAVYAERADIAEEISRLSGHLDQFQQIIGSNGEAAGRTLDFLAQELLREANTIASKSNDVTISRAIVEVKGAIDRIKEQVQNVE